MRVQPGLGDQQLLILAQVLADSGLRDRVWKLKAILGRVDRIVCACAPDPRHPGRSRLYMRISGQINRQRVIDWFHGELVSERTQELKSRVAAAALAVTAAKDRVAWSERMVQKGFQTNQQADAEKARLKTAELALEQARRDLNRPTDPKVLDVRIQERSEAAGDRIAVIGSSPAFAPAAALINDSDLILAGYGGGTRVCR